MGAIQLQSVVEFENEGVAQNEPFEFQAEVEYRGEV